MRDLAVDLFAGPGGWDVGARALGLDPVGFELDRDACATRAAAGLRTVRADVSQVATGALAGRIDLLIASPPCQAFSNAGKGGGKADMPLLWRAMRDLGRGVDSRAELRARSKDPRSLLIVEPLHPVGPENNTVLRRAVGGRDLLVAAWGARGTLRGRAETVLPMFGHAALCLGLTKTGQPRHPLYVRSGTPLVRLDPP